MRNKSKITTLESKFPLLSVEQGCMVSKDADITVAFRVELPELFTVTSAEYEAMHSAWHKAIKVLPNYSIVHKQDWFIKEDYQGKLFGYIKKQYEKRTFFLKKHYLCPYYGNSRTIYNRKQQANITC